MFNHLDYNIYHLGISGGKDSTAALLWLVHESGWPLDRARVTFCDTGNEDALTYSFINMLSEKVFSIEKISAEMSFYELAHHKKRFPSTRARFCTQYLKIIPSREYVLRLSGEGNHVLVLNGVRNSEGHATNGRASARKFEFDDGWGCDIYRPIVDWSIMDVWEIARKHLCLNDIIKIVNDDDLLENREELIRIIRANGVPRNPLYDMGARRVGCFPCINSSKNEIRAMAKYRPSRIEFLEQMESWVSEVSSVGYASLFPRDKVPPNHRTVRITTKGGDSMLVASISDVVRWSKTAMYKPNQFSFDPQIMHDSISACDIGGMCE